LSTDFTPLTAFTICSAFAFVAAELTLPVKTARASLMVMETAVISGSSFNLIVATSCMHRRSRLSNHVENRLALVCWLLNDQFGPTLTDGLGVNTGSLKSLTQ
jgi:hypothetical protein